MTRNRMDRWVRRLLVGGLSVVFASAAMTSGSAAAEKVRVGSAVSWPGYSLLHLAQLKGLAPDLDMEIIILDDPLNGHSMLAAGQLDVYESTVDYIPIAIENGLKVKNVTYSNISYGVDQIVTASGIETADDIRGKRVAAPEAFIGELLMGQWLDTMGIGVDEVEWVNLAADEAVGAMMAGDIAVAYLYEPWATQVVDNLAGSKRVAHSAESVFLKGAMYADSIFMTDDFIANHRETAEKVIKARWDGLKWWTENPAEGNQIIADYLKWPVSDVEYVIGKSGKMLNDGTLYMYNFMEAARFCGATEGAPPFDQVNGQIYETVKLTNEWWMKLGLMKATHDPQEGVDCSLMKELVDSGYRG